MKEIKAIVQPFMVEHVLDALAKLPGLPGLTVSQVIGWGKTRAVDAEDRIHETGHTFARKTKLEVVVVDEMAETIVDAIVDAAHTGKTGDGKVFVTDIAETVKIRTGDKDNDAV